MEDKNSRNISETFGKYTDSSAFGQSGGYNKIRQPQNVSSSMWEPISGGSNIKNQTKEPSKAMTGTNKPANRKKTDSPISEGRPQNAEKKPKKAADKKPQAEKSGAKKAEKKKNAVKKKPSQKSRTPKGRPVTQEMMQEAVKNSQQAKNIRRQEQLKKSRRDYDEQLRQGKSHNEISKKRAGDKKRKRRIRTVATVLLFLIFVGAFFGAYFYAKGAPIAKITVEGESSYKTEEIIDSAEIEIGLNMFTLREKKINKKVTSELPYVHSVDLKRRLPDTVVLTVNPTADKYLIVNDKGYICVDEYGKVLSDKKRKLRDGSFRLNGFEAQQVEVASDYVPSDNNKDRFETAEKIVKAIEAKGVMKKAVINVEDLSDVKITYDSRIMIYLGDCKDLENRINIACDVIVNAASQGQTGYIDTRYDGRAYFNEGTMKVD